MKLLYRQDPTTQEHVYTLTIDHIEFATMSLSQLDKGLLRDTAKSSKLSDKMLAIHMMVKRIEDGKHDTMDSR